MHFLLTLAIVVLIFLNGATDASNAIAASVSSGALRMRQAALLSAVCNTAGGIIGGIYLDGIAKSVIESADFGTRGETGVLAALASSVIFTFCAWIFCLPTSESHALLAAAAGASVILGESTSPARVLLPAVCWMTLCTVFGFLSGIAFGRFFPHTLKPRTVCRLQIFCAAAAAFLHGAQDLVKFTALLYAAGGKPHPFLLPAAAAMMGLGTLCGGRRMTEAVGDGLASLDSRTALATDLASAASLAVLSLLGIPASTTHTRTASAAGGALVSQDCCLHSGSLFRFAAAWILTFPVCAALSALLCKLLVLFCEIY